MTVLDEFWIGSASEGIHGTPNTEVRKLLLHEDGTAKLNPGVEVGQNPMYLAWSDDHQLLIVAHETDPAELSAWRPDGVGLKPVGVARGTGSRGACHLSVTKSNWIAVANYFGGALTVQGLTKSGVGDSVSGAAYEGSGPHPDRQKQSHPHQAFYDAERDQVLVPDLGSDRVHRHRVDSESGELSTLPAIEIHPGAGPRHLVVVGRFAVLVNELDGTLSVIDLTLDEPQVVGSPVRATDWDEPAGAVSGSAIRATSSGLILVGNRGPNTISVFRFDQETGGLTKVDEHSTHGEHPRDFELTSGEKYVVVANQASDSLTVMTLDPDTGTLGYTGNSYASNSPVAVLRI